MPLSYITTGSVANNISIVTTGNVSASFLNVDNGLLYVDATNNRIGVSNTAPTEQFHMTGNLRIGNAVAETPTGSAPLAFCRAWVNFNGTGTVAIRASYNVTSITDNGAGDYTVNFTTAMPDANYSVSGLHNEFGPGAPFGFPLNTLITSGVRFRTIFNNAAGDVATAVVAIFR